ncbi:SDR family NAD(P)-dependent oxidoreductase [Chitinophaga pinensis]|uniref:Short-chain dehydrogenase/reductase SDR n=1 Tax=Chitinophaga pinensis (strain ATCC 43595 / DSM 2588 / LMG 13176 / NBRC 15968 / NCIMB 11800 / UQM 2034) TaxID=485918 RepID=A0A979GYT7_CHIPD|nr:SDR family NAD(P)-dependent oxidoreductase [Chitinophaga pinensis]ACU62015.1 short-chain dehydrogenase/reductase SDR [Chitinophaga pinensis DSM 2588]
MNNSKVWYVTGASQGLGLTLVKALLANGYRVAATSRDAHKMSKAVGLIDNERFLPLVVDLNNADCIDDSVERTLAAFGRIDVLVNNAGYGMTGTVEETTAEEISQLFAVNVLAGIAVVKRILPVMRTQQSGHIINIGSVAGFVGAPGWAIYSATKAAIAAFSEVLAKEVSEFGIKVTVVAPSGFRTGFLTPDSLSKIASGIAGYELVKRTQQQYLAMDGQQAGDPDRAAAILIALVGQPAPPLHLFLGRDAYVRAARKLSTMKEELEQLKDISVSADFDQ